MARDADWEMFCRGRPVADEEAGRWLDSIAPLAGDGPVRLSPDDEAPGGGGEPATTEAEVRHFRTRVVGVVYPNEDGTSRREAVRGLRRLDRVRLVHRPDNPVDANAVAVLRDPDGRQLGYLPAILARDVVAAARDRGTRYLAVVTEVTGGDPRDLIAVAPVGADLLVLALEGGATKPMARHYLLELLNGQ